MSDVAPNAFCHIPVLLDEVIANCGLSESKRQRLIDGTIGGGGHSAALLRRFPKLEILGIDRDCDALEAAAKNLSFAKERVTLAHGDYADYHALSREIGWDTVDAVLLDIGVSSYQIDTGERGFAWRLPGPLDMRMDRAKPLTASVVLNRYPQEKLERIFRDYGEIREAKLLARRIVEARAQKPFETTDDFAGICRQVLRRSRTGAPPEPTLAFQAVRIEVNDELGQLRRALSGLPGILNPGGRALIISFHSLEDRLVKEFFRLESSSCICPPGLPVCVCGHRASLRMIERKPLTATAEEISRNRRSACAKLRVAEKL